MTDTIKKLIDEFTAAYDATTKTRLELDAVVNSIDAAEANYKTTEAAVNQGTAYSDELHAVREHIDKLKKQRDEVSARLKLATCTLAKSEQATIKPIGHELLRLFGDVTKAEAELQRAADTLLDFAQSLPKKRWIFYRELSPVKRTVICSSGLRDNILNNGDFEYFNRLKEEIESYEHTN